MDNFLERLLEVINAHGEAEGSETQIGDLEQVAWALWEAMPVEQRQQAIASARMGDLLEVVGEELTAAVEGVSAMPAPLAWSDGQSFWHDACSNAGEEIAIFIAAQLPADAVCDECHLPIIPEGGRDVR
jgi:hypothetical protein